MSNVKIVIGPPGTGKTTELLNILDKEFEAGVPPDRICFTSFTKKAETEAQDRACERFSFEKADLPWFRTLHSLAFSRLGLRREEVMQGKHYREIGRYLNLVFGTKADIEEGLPTSRFTGDRYTFLDGFARARCITAEQAWDQCAGEADELNWYEFKRFQATLKTFKAERNLVDFTDMMEMDQAPLDVDVVIVDEAQDLSSLQWAYARRILFNAKRIYIAGDDDQAIFQWSGADVKGFQNLNGSRTVLHQSHRVPSAVHKVAERIVNQIKHRTPKTYLPKAGVTGSVEYHASPDDVDLTQPGTWLLLARNTHLLQQYVGMCRAQGVNYSFRGDPAVNSSHIRSIQAWEARRAGKPGTYPEADEYAAPGASKDVIWHEAMTKISLDEREWYISMLRRGEKLSRTPRISIGTIHSVKGGEADNVLLSTDMSARTWHGAQQDPGAEHRVWYVGCTRAKQNLHIIAPTGRMGYEV